MSSLAGPKILMWDIECLPAVVDSWGLFKQSHSINQIVEDPRMISFAARWYGTKKVIFKSEFHDGRQGMLDSLHALMDETDALCSWNGRGFDTKWARAEFLREGMTPPSAFKEIDLMMQVRGKMRFISNKLDYVSQALGVGQKNSTGGHELWTACRAGDPKAWAKMRTYNIQDVNLLVSLYDKLLPWLDVPNPALYGGETDGCPRCQSTNFQSRGFHTTTVGKYRRFQCSDCGGWFKSKSTVQSTEYRGV